MGCESCSNNSSGLPKGCKNNGACGVSGCNKLEVFDWLSGMQLPDNQSPYDIVEVRFKNSRKGFYRNSEGLELHIGDVIVVESSPGYDVGVVSLTGELVKIQLSKKNVKDNHEIRKIQRKASDKDIDLWQDARMKEKETMIRSREIAQHCGLAMKISDVEYQGDSAKATFYYTAEDRVDFRELIRKLAEAFKVRIEMRQIGMRQEAGRLGGIGSCGRELCCSTWLTDFRSVSTGAARYQQLSLNPQKLAGQCGKLKCCLNYELDQYKEAVKEFPSSNVRLELEGGRANHFKTDIFKRIMYFMIEGERGGSPVAVSLDDVLEIMEMNKRGEKPMSLQDFSITQEVELEDDFMNVVGQDSLTRFDKKKRKKRPPRNKRSGQPQNKQGRGQKPKSGGGQSKARNDKGGVQNKGGNTQQKSNNPQSKSNSGQRPNRNKRRRPSGKGKGPAQGGGPKKVG
ncbi:MAG: hypothetical protein MK081_05175 [Flavobacteriales bacterium]|nr:hypothetical protein [Flavobacteriales bacterium]